MNNISAFNKIKSSYSISKHQFTRSQIVTRGMPIIPCSPDHPCPYQYTCLEAQCLHESIFPIHSYPIAVYSFFPIASAICNTSGNSFGEFKVLLLMDILNYSEAEATTLCYPLVLGTALYNLIRLIFKRHPYKQTSIVDYNLVIVIIPNVLYGSTIGSLVNNLMPPILADCLIIVLLIAFSVKFFLKLKLLKKKAKLGKHQKQQTEVTATEVPEQSLNESEQSIEKHLLDPSDCNKQGSWQLEKQLRYERTNHWPHILTIFVLFIAFQSLVFLAQGKIIHFSRCSSYYAIGIIVLTVVYFSAIFTIFSFTKKKIKHYRHIHYAYEYPLDRWQYFSLICIGSFLGGFNGGAFAIGNSTTIIFTLLYLQVQQIVVSATVGFQVAFAAAASLLQALATGNIELEVVGFFFVLTFIFGGLCSWIVDRLVSRLNREKVNMVLVGIVASLTCMSSISMVINIALGYINFGSDFMNSSSGLCP